MYVVGEKREVLACTKKNNKLVHANAYAFEEKRVTRWVKSLEKNLYLELGDTRYEDEHTIFCESVKVWKRSLLLVRLFGQLIIKV